ncbi:putative ribonuclease H-like domain-containing protein [Tanacetum coccineum]
MYRSQSPRGNQRNWNGQKSNQLGSDFVMYNKAFFICGSFDHMQAHCKYHQRERMVYGNNYNRVNYNYTTNMTHPNAKRNMVPRAVLMKTGLKPFNTARTVNTAHPKSTVFSAKPMSHFSKSAQSTVKPQQDDTGFIDSGCSRHMNGNITYLSDFNCLMKSDIFLKIPRKDNMYSFDMKNIVPKESLTCLVAKATSDESMLWHRRLGHINFKNINKLVKDNLVRGLPTKRFENDQTYVDCLKGKQHRASCLLSKMCGWEEAIGQMENLMFIFDSPSKLLVTGDTKSATDEQKQVEDGPHNESDKKDKSEDDSSPKEVNAAGQHVNTTSPEVNTGRFKLNTVDPSVNTSSSYELDSPKDMFKLGASHTLETTHVEFFSDEDEPEVDLGNITNSYIVPTTPNIKIHKDHPIKNVIGDKTHDTLNTCLYACFLSLIEPTSIAKALSDSSWVEAMQEELLQFKLQQVWKLMDLPNGKRAIRTKNGMCTAFKKLMKDKFQMTSMGELTFFLRLQVTQKKDGIFISQDKYVAEIFKNFNYTDVKVASIKLIRKLSQCGVANDVDLPSLWYSRDSPFELVAYTDSDYAGATQDRKSTTRGCQFLGNRHVKRGWDTKIPQSSGPPIKVGDEVVHKELGDRMERAATTASSLEAEQDSGNINRTQCMATLNEASP